MARKRTTVFADEDDLAIIKAAAVRRGVAQAELLREVIHLVAMAQRTWSEPLFSHTYAPEKPAPGSAEDALHAALTAKAEAYERTRRPT